MRNKKKVNEENNLLIENLKELDFEREIYTNNYIRFSIIEKIKYSIKKKTDIPNYLESALILKDYEIDEYGINIDKLEYVAIIEKVSYGLKFNDKIHNETYENLKFLYCDDNKFKFELYDQDGCKGTITISFSQVVFKSPVWNNARLIYSSLNIPLEDFENIKKSAKRIATLYIKNNCNNLPAKLFYETYNNYYKLLINSNLEKIVTNSDEISKKFTKVKRRDNNDRK